MAEVRVGIVGTGFGLAVHAPAWTAVPGVRVTAVCGARPARTETVAAQAGIPGVAATVAELVARNDVDVVSISSPPYLHYEHALLALQAGKHVLCEKPFTHDLAQARELLSEAERRGLAHAIAHEFRYLPRRRQLKALIESGAIGTPRLATWRQAAHFMWSPDGLGWGWLSRADRDGGFLGASGSHLIDTLCYLLGDPTAVSALLSTFVPTRKLPDGETAPEGYAAGSDHARVTADDSFAILLRFAGGAQGIIHATATAPQPATTGSVSRMGSTWLEIIGSEGTVRLEDDSRLYAVRAGEPYAELPLPDEFATPDDPRDYRIAPLSELAGRMAAAIRGEQHTPFPTFADGVRVQAVMDAARSSAAGGLAPVTLS